jgi:hypothetical protein
VIPELGAALVELRPLQGRGHASSFAVTTKRSSTYAIVGTLGTWFRALGYVGCSSHSGWRTIITNAARKISTVWGSLRDVQMLAGHSALSTTQRYVEADAAAQRRIVDIV